MMRSKQIVIEEFGHFYVLCERHPETDKDCKGGYLARVFGEASRYNSIGNLEFGWKPRPPKQLEIWEFFGEPESKEKGYGVLEGMDFWKDRNVTFFKSIEEAEKKADEIRTQHNAMYEELRRIKAGLSKQERKKKKMDFDLATPDLPTVYQFQPDIVEFPKPIKAGDKMYAFYSNVDHHPLRVREIEVSKANLYPAQLNSSDKPFSYGYRLKLSLWLPAPAEEGEVKGCYLHDHTFFIDQPQAEGWRYNFIDGQPPRDIHGIHFADTHENAEKRARDYAEKLYANIRAFLPGAEPEAPVSAPEVKPAGP